jgi:hypothetical protein
VRGNSHARFLEGWAGAIPPGYSTGVGVSLARNRRSPKGPSEPRPSGVHPEEDEVKRDGEASPRFIVITFETRSGLASYTLEFSDRLL